MQSEKSWALVLFVVLIVAHIATLVVISAMNKDIFGARKDIRETLSALRNRNSAAYMLYRITFALPVVEFAALFVYVRFF